MAEQRATRECPHCLSIVDGQATVCPNCQQRIKESKIVRNLAFVIFVVIGLVICGVFLSAQILAPAVENVQQDILDSLEESDPASRETKAYLNCPVCADIGVNITLWAATTQIKAIGQLPHGTEVEVHESKASGGKTWYRVSAKGETGWVSAPFVSSLSP
jgi:hypothetical protein